MKATTIREQLDGLQLNKPVTHYVMGDDPFREFKSFHGDHPEAFDKIFEFTGNEKWLDVKFDSGYGGEGQPPMILWTDTYVIFVVCYDGATWLSKLPRNPTIVDPVYHGGG